MGFKVISQIGCNFVGLHFVFSLRLKKLNLTIIKNNKRYFLWLVSLCDQKQPKKYRTMG